MSLGGFKSIQPVPALSDFLDIVLSRTQRKTPTVVHKGYAISRIRGFYMRKVKFTQETFDEKLGSILTEFPRLDDVHPFYADLMNILYDKDHYKLALAQINTAKHLIDMIGKEYLKLLKFGDSLYRCKQLKRAALGRMATVMKRQKETLVYLEQVRQHLSRLPAIDPNTRTLLICGYPNVGKSSFMNKVTRANVDVQPYAFTTKSLFVGHFDYRYLRWQVIDTPGILDHPLEQRNTIEMQSITALAHLRACVLFFLDISESCGWSIAEQVALFNSLKPLFAQKPTVMVLSKVDLIRPEALSDADRALLQSVLDAGGVEMLPISSVTEEGVMELRNCTCEKLMAQRVDAKLRSNKIGDVLNRLHLAQPAPRDTKTREPCIPTAVLEKRAKAERKLARDEEAEMGGAGVFNVDLKRPYLLVQDEWKYDTIPELLNGKNIADFIDPEIEARLLELEAEEERLEAAGVYDESADGQLTAEQAELLEAAIGKQQERKELVQEHRAKKRFTTRPVIPSRIAQRKRTASSEAANDSMDVDSIDEEQESSGSKRVRTSVSRSRALSAAATRDRSVLGLRDDGTRERVEKMKRLAQKRSNLHAKRGEADRDVSVAKPKHLFSGKRKSGTNDRR